MFEKCLYVFFISMLPIIELRGGIPVGAGLDIPFFLNYAICVVGNMLPVPFLILFSKKVASWLAEKRTLDFSPYKGTKRIFYRGMSWVGNLSYRIICKADVKAKKIGTYELLGLFLFVAIPLPGTGAWTGSLIAAILRLRLMKAWIAILCGVICSGLIMGVVSFGLLELLGL